MPTLADLSTGNPDFSILSGLVLLSDANTPSSTLLETLSDPAANVALFAPTNDAFVALAQSFGYGGDPADLAAVTDYIYGKLDDIGKPDVLLEAILGFHLQDPPGAALPVGATVADNDPDQPDATVLSVSVADNGTAYVIDQVLLPLDVVLNENLATNGDDILTGTDGKDLINLLDGDDVWSGGGKSDSAYGGAGNDDISGGWGNDKFLGGTGNDTLTGDDGKDQLLGQQGDDTVFGGKGDDFVQGGQGNDLLYGGSQHDDINGGDGDDTAYGGTGDDDITGNAGKDELYGGSGGDLILGGNNDDFIFGDHGGDDLFGGNGDDYVSGGKSDDVINGDDGDDILLGDAGADLIFGGRDADTLFGGAGEDTLAGGSGDDRISGGKGDDKLSGNTGADIFVFRGVVNHDRITDFGNGADKIDLTDYDIWSVEQALMRATQDGDDAVIRLGQYGSIRLEDVQLTDLTEDDFIFGFTPIITF